MRDVRFTDSFKEAGIQNVVILGLEAGGANARGCSRLRCQVFRGAFRSGYAGWRVSADQVGHGIATPGVIALLDLAFTNEPDGLGLHRVQANVMPSNGASARVAEKAGFRLEGRAKEYLKINGVWQDHLMYAKLSDEHEARFLVDSS